MITVEVVCNPDCAHCVHALDVVTQLALDQGVPIAGVDARAHPERAGAWEHSPLVVVGARAFAGVPTPDEFAALVQEAPGGASRSKGI